MSRCCHRRLGGERERAKQRNCEALCTDAGANRPAGGLDYLRTLQMPLIER